MKKLFLLAVAALIVFLGCGFMTRDFYLGHENFPDEFSGGILLVLDSSAIPTRTIQPPPGTITMDAVAYDIHLGYQGNSNLDIDITNHTGVTYKNNGLIEGTWNIGITAYNSTVLATRQVVGALGGVVGSTVPIPINAGDVIVYGDDGSLPIIPIDGTGDLSLDLIWAEDLTPTSADVEVYLIPLASMADFQVNPGNYTANELVFTVPASPGNEASYGDPDAYDDGSGTTHENDGYYGLYITILDNTTPVLGIPPHAVRIITGYESYGNLNLQGDTGTLTLEWDVNLQNPVDINFGFTDGDGTSTPILSATEIITVTATLVYPTQPSASYNYEWYIDGLTTGDTGPVTDTTVPIQITYDLNGIDVNANFPNTGDEGTHHLGLLITGLNGSAVPETLSSNVLAFAVE